MSKKTLVLIDDHAVVRNGCRQLLESCGDYAIHEARNAQEGRMVVAACSPDVIILDLNLPDQHGLDLLADLVTIAPASKVLIFTMHDDASHARRALALGVQGYVTKTDDADVIITAVEQILAGQTYLSQPVAQALALAQLRVTADPLTSLTRREREALTLFAQGKTLSDIATALQISYKTVANTMSLIKTKLNVSSSAELMRLAITLVK